MPSCRLLCNSFERTQNPENFWRRPGSTRKGRNRSKRSQTDDDDESAVCSCHSCLNMANSVASIKKKLDEALRCIQEIEALKQTQRDVERTQGWVKLIAQTTTATLEKEVADQGKAIGDWKEVANIYCWARKERAIINKPNSHIRRNKLIFFNIPKMILPLNLDRFFATLCWCYVIITQLFSSIIDLMLRHHHPFIPLRLYVIYIIIAHLFRAFASASWAP